MSSDSFPHNVNDATHDEPANVPAATDAAMLPVAAVPPTTTAVAAVAPMVDGTIQEAALKTSDAFPPILQHPPLDSSPLKKRKRRYTTTEVASSTSHFNNMLYQLLLFRCQKGHTRVPAKSGGALAKWANLVRMQYAQLQQANQKKDQDVTTTNSANNTIYPLDAEQIQVLNSLEFAWDMSQYDHDLRWQCHFDELVEYKNKHGHTNVPQSVALGKWLKTQRENYRKVPNLRPSGRPFITQERIGKLESLEGFQWNVNPPAVGWETRFVELLQYKQQYGNPHVPQGYKESTQLGRWVMKQRSQYSLRQRGLKSQLTQERVQRLEAIGFRWARSSSSTTSSALSNKAAREKPTTTDTSIDK